MVLSIWDIFRFIFKWKWLIAALVIVCMLFSTFYVSVNQSTRRDCNIIYRP